MNFIEFVLIAFSTSFMYSRQVFSVVFASFLEIKDVKQDDTMFLHLSYLLSKSVCATIRPVDRITR